MDQTSAGPDPDTVRSPATHAAAVTPVAVGAADLAAVLLFVVLGRRAHHEGSFLVGTVAVALPFLAGAAAGWALLLLLGRPAPPSVRGGLVVLAATVPVGMALRALTGRGVQLSFVLVAAVFLALFLVGHRLLVPAVRRWRRS
jgi:Protein of unknown function (DUF3054)